MSRKPLHPRPLNTPFVGYLETPQMDRRFLLGFAGAALLGGAGLTALIAKKQNGAGRGQWDMGTPVTLTGRVATAPYAHIRVAQGQTVRTILLGCETKCGVRERLDEMEYSGGMATATGTLIERDGYGMLAVPDGVDWLVQDASASLPPPPVALSLGEAELSGEILDTKCWFGAMRPNEGLSHKACATLCIANGIPPYFGVRDRQGRDRALMITDPDGEALVTPLLPFVAEPVRARGQLIQLDDLIQFRMNPDSLMRL